MHLSIQGIHKRFGHQAVLKDCHLAVDRGEIVTLLGPSGCGKTTLLRCIAGFYIPEQGRIQVGQRDISQLPPNRRQVGMVFQNYALFPHLTVAANVAYGLSVRGVARQEQQQRTQEALALVEMDTLADRYPAQLSGGQQQRVALARCLVLEPEVLLLDEPFNALDARLRQVMQVELRKLIKRVATTAIFVTHDQEEALTVSDRVAVMRGGVIEQLDPPLQLYDAPQSRFVADFIGRANLLEGVAESGHVSPLTGLRLATDLTGPVVVAIRPEHLSIAPGEGPAWQAEISFVRALGALVEYELMLPEGPTLRVLSPRQSQQPLPTTGTTIQVRCSDPGACRVLPRESPSTTPP